MNPVTAGIAKMPEEYPWSSYNFFVSKTLCKPGWLICEETLAYFNNGNKQYEYTKFVLEGINHDKESIYEKKKGFMLPILGSDEFIFEINNKYISCVSHEEIPECKVLKKYNSPSIENIISVISKYFNIDSHDIVKKPNRRKGNIQRKIALYFAFRLNLNNRRDICKIFEGISYRSVSQICRRVEMELNKNCKISNNIEEIKKILFSELY